MPTILLVCLTAPETQIGMKHRNRFEFDMCYHGGGSTLLSHSSIRRKGVGWDSEVLRGVEPSTPGMCLIAMVVRRGMPEGMKSDDHLSRGLRWVQEERQRGVRHVRDCVVLIPNRPAVRTGWSLLTQRSHPPLEEANRLDWLSEALPESGTG